MVKNNETHSQESVMNDLIVKDGSGFAVIPEGKSHIQGTRVPCAPEVAQAHPELAGKKPSDPLSEVRNAIDSLDSTERHIDRQGQLRQQREGAGGV